MKSIQIEKYLRQLSKIDMGKFNKKKRIMIDIALIGVGLIGIFLTFSLFSNQTTVYTAKLDGCIDGDTIRLIVDYKTERVRLLAVDTPELEGDEYYSLEASMYTCDVLTNAEKITVELDKKANKYDKYERLLAWVFIDGELLQELLIENGYAKTAYLYDEYKYTDNLLRLEKEAKNKKIGIWGFVD